MSDESTFRDAVKQDSPTWLRTGNNEKLLYTFGLHLDAIGDATVAGLQSRFPNYYSNESLPLIGQERRIERGVQETDDQYAARLRRWLVDHANRGGPYALLRQLYYHYADPVTGLAFRIDLIYRSGRRFSMPATGPFNADGSNAITMDDTVFEPDSHPEQWARWWLYYHAFPSLYGGITPTDAQIADIRLVPRAWIAAHCIGHIVLLSGDDAFWDSGTTWDSGTHWDGDDSELILPVEPEYP